MKAKGSWKDEGLMKDKRKEKRRQEKKRVYKDEMKRKRKEGS